MLEQKPLKNIRRIQQCLRNCYNFFLSLVTCLVFEGNASRLVVELFVKNRKETFSFSWEQLQVDDQPLQLLLFKVTQVDLWICSMVPPKPGLFEGRHSPWLIRQLVSMHTLDSLYWNTFINNSMKRLSKTNGRVSYYYWRNFHLWIRGLQHLQNGTTTRVDLVPGVFFNCGANGFVIWLHFYDDQYLTIKRKWLKLNSKRLFANDYIHTARDWDLERLTGNGTSTIGNNGSWVPVPVSDQCEHF